MLNDGSGCCVCVCVCVCWGLSSYAPCLRLLCVCVCVPGAVFHPPHDMKVRVTKNVILYDGKFSLPATA